MALEKKTYFDEVQTVTAPNRAAEHESYYNKSILRNNKPPAPSVYLSEKKKNVLRFQRRIWIETGGTALLS